MRDRSHSRPFRLSTALAATIAALSAGLAASHAPASAATPRAPHIVIPAAAASPTPQPTVTAHSEPWG